MDVDLEGGSKFNCVALSPSPRLFVAASTGALWSRESISLPAISLVALFQWKWCIDALDSNEHCARRSCSVYIWSFDAAVYLNSSCINCQVECNLQALQVNVDRSLYHQSYHHPHDNRHSDMLSFSFGQCIG